MSSLTKATAELRAFLAKDEQSMSSSSTNDELPPNIGYRTWHAHNGWLHSPSFHTKWESPVLHGQCNQGLPFSECFKANHGCGIYSLKSATDPQHEGYQRGAEHPVFGTIRHHGAVLEGEKGYRSQNATIDTLWTPDEQLATQLEHHYPGVQVIREDHHGLISAAKERLEAERAAQLQENERRRKRAQITKQAKAKFEAEAAAHLKGGGAPEVYAKQLGQSNAWHDLVSPSAGPTSSWKYKPGEVVYPAQSAAKSEEDYYKPLHYVGGFASQGGSGHIVMTPDGKIRKIMNVQHAHELRGGDPTKRGAKPEDIFKQEMKSVDSEIKFWTYRSKSAWLGAESQQEDAKVLDRYKRIKAGLEARFKEGRYIPAKTREELDRKYPHPNG